jgi:acetyl-CoA acetyltransferase
MASRYCHLTGTTEADLAELAVLMRRHASTHPDAHLRELIDVHDVLASKPVSLPLKLLDCCPISDGAVAMIVSGAAGMNTGVCIAGAGQAHQHQHLTAMPNVLQTGAGISSRRALAEAGMTVGDIDLLAIYDSFTITLAMLLEEIGFADRGQAGACARAGAFGPAGPQPLNLHGGLLSFGHSGVAGGMVHVVEVVRQLRGTSFNQSISGSSRAFVHADGGVMSAHISIILERMS